MNENTLSVIKSKLTQLAPNGILPCAKALKLAFDEQVSPSVIGEQANLLKIKISNCQLGCFK